MTQLTISMECDESHSVTKSGNAEGSSYDGEATVRIANGAAENGYDQEPGPLTWLNSARIVTDPEEDSVTCLVSVGDPRGAFAFTVRRLPDGRLVIHTPYPGQCLPHMDTKQHAPGSLLVGHNTPDGFKPADFSDAT